MTWANAPWVWGGIMVAQTPPSIFDILFLVDRTGSMGTSLGPLDSVKDTVSKKYLGAKMGIATFCDFPILPYGESSDWVYALNCPLTNNMTLLKNYEMILPAGGGGDGAEAQFDAVARACGDTEVGWQAPGKSIRIVIIITDSSSHVDDGVHISMPNYIQAVKSSRIIPIYTAVSTQYTEANALCGAGYVGDPVSALDSISRGKRLQG